jgi:hypothetical protein
MNNGAKKMSKYEVSDNMPIPTKILPSAGRGDKGEVLALKIGQSLFIPGKTITGKNGTKTTSIYAYDPRPGIFVVRPLIEKGITGIRVWRIAE